MVKIANMLWRIGDLLDFDKQLVWIREAGFDGVGFHASAGTPGHWRGVEPRACDAQERTRLRREIAPFAFVEIHAPFSIELRSGTLASDMATLMPILDFAVDLGVETVTVHAHVPGPRDDPDSTTWRGLMQDLDRAAGQRGTTIALEIVSGFGTVIDWGLPHVGINLDVGHMYLPANHSALLDHGGIGMLIRRLGDTLVHLHLHDVRGETDHIEAGTGMVQFSEMAAALRDIGYRHNATLELNPDRVSPEGILRSAVFVRQRLREVGIG